MSWAATFMPREHHATWPRLPDTDHRVACHYCDTLHDVALIEEGQAAHCLNCGEVLYRNRPASLSRAVSFGITALCLMVLVMLFPFISMDAAGNKSSVSVPGAIVSLWEASGALIAISVLFFVILLPALLLFFLLYLCLPLFFGKALPGSVPVMRWFLTIQSWIMVEVFFLGAIVSLLKLVKLARIDLGIGFWSCAALMFCIAGAIGGIDRIELWDRLELARRKKEAAP